jgi:hypothetical protein
MTLIQKLRAFARHHFTDHPHDGPEQETLLRSITRLSFDIDTHYARIKSLGPNFKTSVIETIEYKGTKYPIYAIDFQPDASGERLLILAGSHGNEEAGLLATEQYLQFLADSPKSTNLAIRIITPHNPVGSAYFSRYNGQGFDMNRDFYKQATVETKAVVKSFQQFKPTIALSLHEGPQEDGAFFFTNQHVRDDLVKPLLTSLSSQGIALAQKSYFGNKLGIPGYFPATGLFLLLMKLWKLLFKFQGFGQYCAVQKVPALVMETPWSTNESEQRVNAQLSALKIITQHLNKSV